jgi:hypothetical protein
MCNALTCGFIPAALTVQQTADGLTCGGYVVRM